MIVDCRMSNQVLTIGHSNHPIDVFLTLLRDHHIEAVVDTRSHPKSKYAPQYDGARLRQTLRESGIEYIYLGKELGGRPDGAYFYDANGHVFYDKVAESGLFLEGMLRLENEIHKFTLALLCSEENPSVCHRRLLIARVLRQRGFAIHHIRGDGRVESEEELMIKEADTAVDDVQLALFDNSRAPEWKSIPSVLPRRRQNSSSAS